MTNFEQSQLLSVEENQNSCFCVFFYSELSDIFSGPRSICSSQNWNVMKVFGIEIKKKT